MENFEKVNEEVVGRWLAFKRRNAGLSRDQALKRLNIDGSLLKSIEEGSLNRINYLFEKMMGLYEIVSISLIKQTLAHSSLDKPKNICERF